MNLTLIEALGESAVLYAATEIAHTLGFIVLVGAVFYFDLRVLGLVRAISLSALARLLLPWSWASILVIFPTGLAMFAVNADELLDSRPFKVKMALILAAGLNAAFFLTGPWQSVKQWDIGAPAPLAAKLSAVASLFLWTGVITCGRLLAYF
ncbi:MAG: DUF6644 family protein [Usitatibacter sp.]